MLSIIICSRNKSLSEEFFKNISDTVGVEYELISIDNSKNSYSIFSAYNYGISISKYTYLCLIHEDVLFRSKGWGLNVIEHLKNPSTGIIGVAGSDLALRVPASWSNLTSPSQNIIQTDPSGKKAPEFLLEPDDYKLPKRTSILLDGIFLCMRKEITNNIKFDEQLEGFHGYDYDISFQSVAAGFKNYVIYDIKIEHSSKGKTNMLYFRNLISIYRKWEKHLPIIGESVTESELSELSNVERKKLTQLTKKMVRKGFETTEIRNQIGYYSEMIGFKKALQCLKVRIFIIRLFNCPKYLFRG